MRVQFKTANPLLLDVSSPKNVKIHLISVRTKRRELRSETAANSCQNGQKRRSGLTDDFCQFLKLSTQRFKSRDWMVCKGRRRRREEGKKPERNDKVAAVEWREKSVAWGWSGSGGGGSTGPSQYHSPSSGGQGGGDGGNGVVILRYPNVYTATYSGGVTSSTSTVGTDKIDIITATDNSSRTVTFST